MAKNTANEKYAYLNRLSTEQLEELLRADIESTQTSDVDVIFHILEVIEERENKHPTGRLPDEDKAWEEFQQYYNVPEGNGLSLYPCGGTSDDDGMGSLSKSDIAAPAETVRLKRWMKQGLVAAAVVALLFCGMVAAQAAGLDVFGSLGRWTEETFRFVTSSDGSNHGNENATQNPQCDVYYSSLQDALRECGIAEELAPTWYPNGFTAKKPRILRNDVSNTVNVFYCSENGSSFAIDITKYLSASSRDQLTFEKDSNPVEQYSSGAKTFYIFTNINTITATWSDGVLVTTISGNISVDEVKAIINSIGGSIK